MASGSREVCAQSFLNALDGYESVKGLEACQVSRWGNLTRFPLRAECNCNSDPSASDLTPIERSHGRAHTLTGPNSQNRNSG